MGAAKKFAETFKNKAAERAFLRAVSSIAVGKLTLTLPDGERREFAGAAPGPEAELRVHADRFYAKVLLGGEIGFGEAYQEGLCDSPDAVALIKLAIINRRAVNFNKGPLRLVSKAANRRLHLGRRNTVDQAKHNIHAHYDLGNAFFRLWLDETMTYSSALYSSPGEPLAEAQRNKYRALCELADVQASDHVLEIGSGWGGFAAFAAQEFGCRVRSITISDEQHRLASERVAKAGLSDRVTIALEDYRDVAGRFDKIVSIEMFEAVGAEYFEAFFHACARALAPGGRLAMQVITVPERDFSAQRDGVNWIQKHIFPGGVLPSLAEMERTSNAAGFVVASAADIGAHYAQTLHEWRERFWAAIDEVRAAGYDEHFIRTWDYYLALCEAGFATRNTGDVQVLFERPGAVA